MTAFGAWWLRARQRAALGRTLPKGRVAVGVVTYDTAPEVLRRCVRSVRVAAEHCGVEVEVLLVDNGREGGGREGGGGEGGGGEGGGGEGGGGEGGGGPASAAVDGCTVLPARGNVGFGAGQNALMEAAFGAGAAHYLVLNPDAALHPAALGALLRMSAAAGGRALVQGTQFPAEPGVAYDPVTFAIPWVCGACVMVPRAVHAATRGFDPGFFMYCEDVDWSWRARVAGFRTLCCPAALVFHPFTNRVPDQAMHRMFLTSALRLAVTWGGDAVAAEVRREMALHGVAVPDQAGIERRDGRGVADFSHGLGFAKSRW